MVSHFQIPGLGQIQSNETLPVSNFEPDIVAAAASIGVILDTEMTDAKESKLQTVDPQNNQQHHGEVEQKTQEASLEKQTIAVESKEESKHQETKDKYVAPNTTNDIRSAVVIDAAAQNTDMAQDNVNQMDQASTSVKDSKEEAESTSRPASPGVTDALEAAIDGLLGPPPLSNGEAPEGEEQVIDQALEKVVEQLVEQVEEQNEQANGEVDANPEWEVDSSPYESSSDSSDSSSDDDSEDESNLLGIEETARLLMAADGGSDDEADGAKAAKQAASVRTKNEQPDEPEVKPDITITAEETIIPLGIVQHIVEGTQVVIEALRDEGSGTILDRGSVLCTENRTVIGVIHDTIATVHKPMYVISFRSENGVKEAGIEKGVQVWYPKQHALLVFPSQLRQEKGSDASNLHDEEVAPEEMEYSDDEKEQAHKREKKSRKRGGKGKLKDRGEDCGSYQPGSGPPGNAVPKLEYDEDEDGPYKVLTRPAHFGLGLPEPPLPSPMSFPSWNANRSSPTRGRGGGDFRGRGRGGDSRGRGTRGRGFGGRGRGGGNQAPPTHPLPTQPQSQNSHLPPPPFGVNAPPVPVPGQWPFSIPHMPQFGVTPPPIPGNSGFQMPSWSPNPPNSFPFPQVPQVSNWSNQAPHPPQPSGAGYVPFPAAGGNSYQLNPPPPPQQQHHHQQHQPPASSGQYQYPPYYASQAPNQQQQQQHWG